MVQLKVLQMKLLKKIKNIYIGGKTMRINYFAMQIELGWITIETVPKRFRKQVQELVDLSHAGLQDEDSAEQAQIEWAMVGQDVIHEAMQATWTIDKLGGVLATAIIVVILILISGMLWVTKKLVNGFQETNKELLASNNRIATENQQQMARLTEAVNSLSLETRKDISVLQDKVDGLEDVVRKTQMFQTTRSNAQQCAEGRRT